MQTIILTKEFYKVQKVSYKKTIPTLLAGRAKPVHDNIIFYSLEEWIEYAQCNNDLVHRKIVGVNSLFYVPEFMVFLSHSIYLKTTPLPTRRNLWLRDNKKCIYCGKPLEYTQATKDHVIPTCKGGKNKWTNLVTACKVCNNTKGDSYLSDCNMFLSCELRIPTWMELISKNNFGFI